VLSSGAAVDLLSLAQPMNAGLPTEARISRPRPESADH
jgi:hypothetical protein